MITDKFQPNDNVIHTGLGAEMTIIKKDQTCANTSYICSWRSPDGIKHANVFKETDLESTSNDLSSIPFDVGDVVSLTYGGQLMTVSQVRPQLRENIVCQWFDAHSVLHEGEFTHTVLQYTDTGEE